MPTNRRFVLLRRPNGTPVSDDFALTNEPLPDLAHIAHVRVSTR